MISALCTEQAVICEEEFDYRNPFVFPGLCVGCFIAEVLFKSTSECFYNWTCLNIIQLYGRFSSPVNVMSFNSLWLVFK
ncbi:unnamed protein product [Adineta steineri]|uniref:Uncharacterized protein n=1 Tax=Adineta steineri TaxID=433720 RepID=A0A819PR30_9BILA|nr:unnamed protein product [Adineta steineri]CAF4016641.1 unnamed protein product [Adineta steineri]